MEELSDLLGGPPPEDVAALPAADQEQLAALIARARRLQSRDLEAAFAATLKYVPFPVRGLAKKMLLG